MVHPNLEIDGTLTIEDGGELFVPFGGTLVRSDLMHPVDTIADLRNEIGKYKYIYVTGYYAKDDGAFGSNIFVWDDDSTETDNGGTIIKCTTVTTGRYKLRYSGAINVKWFGAKGDCVFAPTFGNVPVGTDDTNAFKLAIATGKSLFIPRGTYHITDTLTISTPIDIDSDKAVLVGHIIDTNKAVIECIGQRNRTWRNFSIQGTSYVPIGIWCKTSDNQAMTIENVSVVTCRYGLYVNEGEVINRIRLINCTFQSNLFAGIYVKSYISTYAHSAPVFIEDTICNGNGIPSGSWFTDGITYQGTTVWSSSTMLKGGYQMYFRGVSSLQVRGGQFSGHSDPRLISLITIEDSNGVSIFDSDIEDIKYPIDSSGNKIISTDGTNTTDYGANYGGAILLSSVSDANIRFKHTTSIQQQSLIKIVYACRQVTLDIPDDSKLTASTYSVSAYGQGGGNTSMINLINISKKISNSSLVCLNKAYTPILLSVSNKTGTYFRPNSGSNIHFDNSSIDVSNNYYQLLYRGGTDPFSVGGCYCTKAIRDIKAIGIINYYQYLGYSADGRLYYSFYDDSGTYISSGTMGFNAADNLGTDTTCITGVVVQVPSNARILKIGYLNSANYIGKIGGGHGNPIGFEVYNLSNYNITNTNLPRIMCN